MNNLEKSFADWKKAQGTVTLSAEEAYKAGIFKASDVLLDIDDFDHITEAKVLYRWAVTNYEPPIRSDE